MTAIMIPKITEVIRILFTQGTCLTFNPYAKQDSLLESCPNRNIFPVWDSFPFPLDNNNQNFHFFSNGTLVYVPSTPQEVLQQFKNIIQKQGYNIKQTLDVQPEIIKAISDYAANVYTENNQYNDKSLPPPDDFLKQIFQDNTICLTVLHKNIFALFKKYFALFSDGTFLVSNKLQEKHLINDFCQNYSKYICFQHRYVPHEYIKIIKEKSYLYHKIIHLKQNKKERMYTYIDNLIKDNYCLSIMGIFTDDIFQYYNPDKKSFALFANGRLVISEKEPNIENLIKEISFIFPQITSIEIKPDYYIPFIYDRLLRHQKTACEMYAEILAKLNRSKQLENTIKKRTEQEARIDFHRLFVEYLKENEMNKLKQAYNELMAKETRLISYA